MSPQPTNPLAITDARLDWGPKMLALTEQQRLFVCELANPDCENYTQAAWRAGYSANSEVAIRVTASRLANNPKVQEALEEYITARLKLSSGMYLNALESIAANPQHKEQRKAASDLLDRAGMAAVHRIEKKVINEIVLTEGQELERIKILAGELGVPLDQLLGSRASKHVVDVEFEVVEPGTPGVGSAEGLEDLL